MNDLRHQAVEQLVPLIPHIEIAHHIPGRIRLRILLSGLLAVQKVDIQGLLLALPGVSAMRLNTAAKSVVIEYNQELIPYDFWQLLGQLKKRPELLDEVTACIEKLLGS